MTAHRPVLDAGIGCKLKQKASEGCNSCASLAGLVLSFIACFILLVIAPLQRPYSVRYTTDFVSTTQVFKRAKCFVISQRMIFYDMICGTLLSVYRLYTLWSSTRRRVGRSSTSESRFIYGKDAGI